MPALSIQHAVKKFSGRVIALNDLSLQLRDGELLAIVGPSGSGKTTLLRAIAGLERLDSGTVRLGDILLDDLSPRHRNVSMVFQQPALYPHLSVRDNIAFPLRMRHQKKPAIDAEVDRIARRLAIQPLLYRRPHQLSGGQAQRVALARALVRKPNCLLLDEPLSNLDAPLRAELRALLKSLHAADPITTLHVTHDQDEALALGDRVAVLSDGRLQQIGTPAEIMQEPANAFVAEF
ncbi:MAG TPA: ABC transporter ATP-binding protein, partial [Pirellulales bacterium]